MLRVVGALRVVVVCVVVGGEGREAEGALPSAPCVACGAPRAVMWWSERLTGNLLSEVSAVC